MSEDRIHIKDLFLRGIIGINDWEREKRQDILINITLFGDLRPAGLSDQIEDCINYRTIAKKVIRYVEESDRFTVEALATDIARLCLEQEGVKRARVSLEKPGALRFARSVGVEIERTTEDFA
ncbi:MAG: dihydroneopterin aldolase [Chloroflexi bacterium RBG_16_48_8]|nr:MAG: dihydroneopterin aldolase [Chloroflexi bacterium RBG_16_48_8]